MRVENKKNVLIIHNYYQIPGGEDSVVANEKRLLEDYGHKVVLYCRNNSELNKMSKLKKLILPFTTVFNMRTYGEVKHIIKKYKIEVVHVHNTLNLISPAVYYIALAMKVPVIQTIHNFRLLCPGAAFYRDGHVCEDCVTQGLKCAVIHGCYRGNRIHTLACVINTKIHRMTGVYGKLNYICLTEFNKEKLLGLKQIKPEKIFVKPNFVDSNGKVIPYEERINQVVYAGRLDKLKGINLLLQVWKRVEAEQGAEAPKLVICGTGPMEDWCKEYIAEQKLKNVEMRGFVQNIETKKIISTSKVLILLTQWYEGFPMAILEAYSVGTPVIGSDIGNVRSLIWEGITGYIVQHDSEDSIYDTLVNSNYDLCDNVRNVYEKNYSRKLNYQQLINIYREAQ